jgi:hypothetical protein
MSFPHDTYPVPLIRQVHTTATAAMAGPGVHAVLQSQRCGSSRGRFERMRHRHGIAR